MPFGKLGGGTSRGTGEGGGGIAAAFLMEKGLGANAQRDRRRWKGLLIGVDQAGAGPDWKMTKVARVPADPIQAKLTFNSGGNNPSTITVTLPANRDNSGLGARGNEWSMPVTAGNVTAVNGNSATKTWTIVSTTTNTYADVAAAMRNSMGAGNVVLTGPGSQRFGNAGGLDFAGGQDAAPIEAEIDSATKTVTIKYDNGDTQAEVKAALDANAALTVIEIAGTKLASSPEAVTDNVDLPLVEYFNP